ncbi:MAG: beta-ketoacyl-[acyl-carrier-protein] synthase family protein [Desulforhopalus sp.]
MPPNSSSNTAITGYGSITAAGINSTTAFTNIDAGVVRNINVGGAYFPGQFVAPCFRIQEDCLQPFQRAEHEIKLPLSGINRTILLALTAIEEALVHTGMTIAELRQKRVGIAIGTTVGCTFHNEEYYKVWREGAEPDPAPLFTYLSSNLAARIQDIIEVTGPRAVITNACASGTDAIGVARTWLQYGLCDIAIAGGADELSRIACHGFKSLMLVSEKSCTPFDHTRQGLNLGEGAGVLVMESDQHVASRQAKIRGRVRGYGIAGDAHHPTAPHPEGKGLQLAVAKALQDAGIGTGDIAMINAHGTGTPANDLAETNAIAELGFDEDKVPVVSTKGATGHTLGAAGGVEAVFTLMALNHGEVSGTVGCKNPDPDFSYNVLQQGRKAGLKSRIGLSQSLAFGGSNAALIIQGEGV